MNSKSCQNCNFQLADEYLYCPKCGQKDTSKLASVRGLIVDFLGDYFTFDSKIFKSLRPLVFRPGFLTLEYLKGKRVSYIPPLRLYLFVSIFFFVVFAQLNPSQSLEMAGENISQDKFDYFIDQHMHKVLFVLLPIFALVLYLFNRRKYSNYFVHFIFSLHFHSFMFIVLALYLIITTYITTDAFGINYWIFLAILIILLVYLFVSQRRVYGDRIGIIIVKIIFGFLLYAISFFAISIISLAFYVMIKS